MHFNLRCVGKKLRSFDLYRKRIGRKGRAILIEHDLQGDLRRAGILLLRSPVMLAMDLMLHAGDGGKDTVRGNPGTKRVIVIVMDNVIPRKKIIKVYAVRKERDGNQPGRYEEKQRSSRNKSIHPGAGVIQD
jgi:hypothetical protein